MTDSANETTVYNFRTFDGGFEAAKVAGFKATMEAIQKMGGDVLQGTGERVAKTQLDEFGCYRRVNTGWGELD